MLPASLHQRGQLIYIKIQTWQARKLDKKATKKIVDESNATANAARVNKYLMADKTADDQLRKIAQIANRTRVVIAEHTVPWNDAGMRLVSNIATFDLLDDIRQCEEQFFAAVDEFCASYPAFRDASLEALGDMADPEDYPPVETIRGKFTMRTSLEPIAPGFTDDRTGLTDEERQQIDDHYAGVMVERAREASEAMIDRLRENLERYVDRLSLTPDGKNKTFTHSMVDNLRDTMTLLGSLGLFDSGELAKIKHDIEVKVCQHDAKELRDSIPAASAALQGAKAALSSLRQIGTAPSSTMPIQVAPFSAPIQSIQPAPSH